MAQVLLRLRAANQKYAGSVNMSRFSIMCRRNRQGNCRNNSQYTHFSRSMCDRFIFLMLKHDDERAAFAAEAVLIVMCTEFIA